jgi:predicted MFS family arabinose efflux permease
MTTKNINQYEVNSPKTVAFIVLLGAFGAAILLEAPVLVGAIVTQLGFSEAQAGYVMSADLGGMGLGSVLALWWVGKINWRKVARVAMIAVAIGNFITILVDSFELLLLLRLVTGTFAGTCMVICIVTIHLMKDPDRGFGFLIMGNLLYQTIAIVLLSRILPVLGLGFAYGTIALAMLIFSFFVHYLPEYGKHDINKTKNTPTEYRRLFWAMLGLISMLSYYIGVTGVWAYIERLGDGAGLSGAMIGNALAISSLLGLLGAGLATILTAKYGRFLPVLTGHILTIVSISILTTSITYSTYIIAACIFNFAWNFVLPYMLACIASVDATGRLVASTNGFVGIGLALGPAMVASVYSPDNINLALWLCCGFVGLSLVLIFRLSLSRSVSA